MIVALAADGVTTVTPSIASSRAAAAPASSAARRWTQSRPTYIDSQPQLRPNPTTDGRRNPNGTPAATGSPRVPAPSPTPARRSRCGADAASAPNPSGPSSHVDAGTA